MLTSRNPSGKIVPIFGPLDAAKNVAVVNLDLQWNKATKSWTKSFSGSLVPIKGVAADPAFVAKFDAARADMMAWVERPIGRMVGKITSDEHCSVTRLSLI